MALAGEECLVCQSAVVIVSVAKYSKCSLYSGTGGGLELWICFRYGRKKLYEHLQLNYQLGDKSK